MNNEEKANELSKRGFKDFNNPYTRVTVTHIKDCCLEMAQWKDEQYKNLIKERIDNCTLTDAYEGVQYETYIALFKDLFNEEP